MGAMLLMPVFAVMAVNGAENSDFEGKIMTVLGPIEANELGWTLVHEHVMCDFIGAKETGKHRYVSSDVINMIAPELLSLKKNGFTGFFDCSPAYLGRDAEVLKKLSELSGIHIIANTGYYGAMKDKFLPEYAFTETADQLAARWVKEWREGIEGTEIRPGFIKVSVDKGQLSRIDEKIVRAAAKAHLQTGLTIACHTGEAKAALGVLEIVQNEGAAPCSLMVVHAAGIEDIEVHKKIAGSGAWLGYDGFRLGREQQYVKLIKEMFDSGFGNRVLVSQDAGWYRIGEDEGGREKFRSFTSIAQILIPELRKAGMTDSQIKEIFVKNPAEAFKIRVRNELGKGE